MKKYIVLFLLVFLSSCQVTETININPDGSGTIETISLRDEQSYMQVSGENYTSEEKFVDTSYVFNEYITQYAENFSKLPSSEKDIFNKFKDVKVHIKKSSFEKEFRTTITQTFDKIEAVPDLYKTQNYADDLKHNYALAAEEHYYQVSYIFDGTIFKRKIVITDQQELARQQVEIPKLLTQLSGFKLVQSFVLNYHFPRKIKSVSNTQAKISEDEKSFTIEFLLADCLQNPKMTAVEVVLE